MDLYSADPESIDENMIEAFLGLDLPPEQRPTEGQRLDFKAEVPEDLGVHAAAFANAFGGIIILGVEPAVVAGKPESNIPGKLIGVPASEVKLRVTHKIKDSVYPVPVFHVIERRLTNDPTKAVVLIRIEAGNHPPYMHLKTKKIPIRRGDSSDPVSYFELETLLQRRHKEAASDRAARARELVPLQYPPENRLPEPTRARNYQSISIIPWDFPQIRLDLNVEKKIESYIRLNFPLDRLDPLLPLARKKSVRARWVEFDKIHFDQLIHRKWRLSHEGVIQFASAIPYPQALNIGDLIFDYFSILKVAQLFLADYDCFGNVDLKVELQCPDITIATKLPFIHVESAHYDADDITGIRVGSQTATKNRASWTYLTNATFDQLGDPVDLAAAIYSEHLREIWQCEFDFERLRDQIKNCWETQFLPNLGKVQA